MYREWAGAATSASKLPGEMGVRKQKSGKKRAFAFTMVTVPPVFSIFVQAVPVPSICLPYGRRLKSAEKSPSTPPRMLILT